LYVLVPLDETTGNVDVVVSNANGTSNAVTIRKVEAAPALLNSPGANGRMFAIMAAPDGTILGKTGTDGRIGRAARPGERIFLFGSGMGPTNPIATADRTIATEAPLATLPTLTINNAPVEVVSGTLFNCGLYQLSLTVPASLADGDYNVMVTAGGITSSNSVFLSVVR
jgi:uncharacterized protein (TIGR03437 family)